MTQERKKRRTLLPKVLVVAALLFCGYAFWLLGNGEAQSLPVFSNLSNERTTSAARDRGDSAAPPPGFPAFTVPIPVAEITDTQYLKLVNRERALSAPVNQGRLVTVWPGVPARDAEVMLHETARQAIQSLNEAAGRAGINNLFIASGFRNEAEQSQLYQNAVDRAYVLPPGHSEHQLGLAADILASGIYNNGGMRSSQEARWLAENAPQFGLILRYPEDKQEITGVAYEPWHFRYVGRVHAHVMGQRGFVLEEYIAYLQETGGFQTTFDGKTYYVLYQRPENGMIFVPEEMAFQISGANTGGYIVTAWR
ncbi:MAG: M15 family metallopeptidase [Oscillospiraceae bacterium]|nr:M15 family metallopeptidase [Oscillospiraceae bacterium]